MTHSLPRQGPLKQVKQVLLLSGMLVCCAAVLAQQAGASPLLLTGERNAGEQQELRLVLDDLSKRRAMVIDLQRELIAHVAVGPESGGDGEEEKARWIESWLTDRGVARERLDVPDERVPSKVRPNIVAVCPGGQTDRTLWLLSHLDVAAIGRRDLWKGDPFALRVDGDAMYGRGVEDSNQGIAASLLLLESLRETGVTPPMRLGLVLTSGALTGYNTGIRHVITRKPHLFAPDDLIVVMDYGSPAGNLISFGEKGKLWLKIVVRGKGGYAGTPDKASNACAAAAAMTNGLHDLEREFLAENPLFLPPGTTFTPTRTENSCIGINHIPSKFVFYVDIRVLAEYSFDSVEKAVRGLADEVEKSYGVHITLERERKSVPFSVTSLDAPVMVALARAIRAQLGVEPKYVGTSVTTAAALLREKGLAAAVWSVQKNMRYRSEECALISAHIKQAQVLARMLFDVPPASPGNAGNGREAER